MSLHCELVLRGKRCFLGRLTRGESVAGIMNAIAELAESVKYTSYKLQLEDGTPVSEMAEVGAYVQHDSAEAETEQEAEEEDHKVLTFVMVPVPYDAMKIKTHVARTTAILRSPPTRHFPLVADAGPGSMSGEDKSPEAQDEADASSTLPILPVPKVEEVFAGVSLERYYAETLLRFGTVESGSSSGGGSNGGNGTKLLTECIKGVSYSGWNPPPANRRAMGDICYLEVVTADEGTFQLTATPGGFYVNRSTRTVFDPAPAPHAHFSHELFDTILGLSASCRSVWKAMCAHARDEAALRQPLDAIATLYGNGQVALAADCKPQWNTPTASDFVEATGRDRIAHGYDMARAQATLSDLFGTEEVGILRDWNEELQSTRAVTVTELSDKIVRAHYVHKLCTDFCDSVKAAVVAITEGHISSANPQEDELNRVYFHNNVFYSKAVDSKENFRVCGGADASRKMAAHDLRNQRLIQAAGIPGLCTVLHCVADYKGDRFIAQNVIPGVLTSRTPARLMYGAVEMGKRFSVKVGALEIMQALCARFYIPTRSVVALPSFKPAGATADDAVVAAAAPTNRLQALLSAEEVKGLATAMQARCARHPLTPYTRASTSRLSCLRWV